MGSDNPSGADNQQETASSMLELDPLWVTGFVDGEGCFSVSSIGIPTLARRAGGNFTPYSTSTSTRGIERFSKH